MRAKDGTKISLSNQGIEVQLGDMAATSAGGSAAFSNRIKNDTDLLSALNIKGPGQKTPKGAARGGLNVADLGSMLVRHRRQ